MMSFKIASYDPFKHLNGGCHKNMTDIFKNKLNIEEQ